MLVPPGIDQNLLMDTDETPIKQIVLLAMFMLILTSTELKRAASAIEMVIPDYCTAPEHLHSSSPRTAPHPPSFEPTTLSHRNSNCYAANEVSRSRRRKLFQKHFETAPHFLGRNGQRGYVPDMAQIAIGLRHRLIIGLRKQTCCVLRRSAGASHWFAMYNGGLFVSFRGC